jgi:isoquinoline 1-oxidoreductase alpha subunit
VNVVFTQLLWVLRDTLGLIDTKYDCGIAACGPCTIRLDGEAEKSCDMSVSEGAGRNITTIEGISPTGTHKVQPAWIAAQVPQCGSCQSGMILEAVQLLQQSPKPTDAEISAAMSNLCVCDTYQRVLAAIHRAASS